MLVDYLATIMNFEMNQDNWACTSANPVLSDSKVLLKFAFCMLKNNTQADFQLKISTPGILAAVRRSGEEVIKIQIWFDLFCKIPLRG